VNQQIRAQLLALAEPEFQQFAAALLPTINNVLGVRLPRLRQLAKTIALEDWRGYLATADDEYFEETMLQGLVIGYVNTDPEERLSHIAAFIPKINNWSVCDSFCSGLKFTAKHPDRVWDFLQPYLRSPQEYELRFAVVMLLSFYINEQYIGCVLGQLDAVKHEGYYVKMAVAWALSICYIKLPDPTLAYLHHNALDDFTYNKALQKITESLRVDQATKAFIRTMRRK